MPDTKSIRPADLLIDPQNPRLTMPNAGQREAIRALAHAQGKKMLALARDIVEKGLNPSDLPIVMPAGDGTTRFIVLEGNRRVVTLKALENPESIAGSGVVEQAVLAEMRRLSKVYQANPEEEINCLVVKDRAEAEHWIQLRHTGENDGAGIVRWGSDEADRFRARGTSLPIHTQALDLLEANGDLTPERRREVPAASYKRLLEAPPVREKCGFEVKDGKLHFLGDDKKVRKALLHIADDLADGKIKTKDIYTKEDRADYAAKLPASIVVTATRPSGEGVLPAAAKPATSRPVKKVKLKPRQRDMLIPRDCLLKVTNKRAHDVEVELRMLSLETYTNAVSVLF